MSILSHLKMLLDEWRYEGVPKTLSRTAGKRSPTQRGELGPVALHWLDENIRNFKKYREQAEAARGTTAVVQVG